MPVLYPRVLYLRYLLTAVSFVFAIVFVFHCLLSVWLLALEDVIKIRFLTR